MNATPPPVLRRRRFLVLVSLLAAPLLLSCGSTRTLDYTLDLAPTTGPLALDIDNYRGSVIVRIDPRLERAQVRATIRSEPGGPPSAEGETPAESANPIPPVDVSAELIEDGPRATLRVRSLTARDDDADSSVHLSISTPRCDGLRISNRGGAVTAINTAGATQITNRDGFVELRTSRPMVDPVTITTTDGNIYFQAPPASTGRFDLHSLDGQTTFIDRVGQSLGAHKTTENSYTSVLNSGTNDIVARTNRGDIRVWIIERPVALTRMFKLRLMDPLDSLYTGGRRGYTRELPVDDPRFTGPSPRAGHAFDY